jgi:O-antigen/teichoic acid export membrane protein
MNDYGQYVALIAKTVLFIVLAELGLGMYLAKEISVNRDDIVEVSSLFWGFLLIKLAAFFLVLAVFLLFSVQSGIVELLLLALIFLNLINISPILMGLEKYKFLTKVQVFTKALLVVLVLMVDFSSFGLEKALFLQVVVTGLTSFLLFIYFIINNKLDKIIFSLKKIKIVLKGSLPFYGAKLFVNLYQQSSTYLVSFLLSAELVAIYSIAIQLYKVGQEVIGAVARVLYTSTVNTKDFLLIKRLTIRSFLIHLAVLPVVFFYGAQILSLIFSFDVILLTELSVIFYLSLLSVIVSAYWGYPALSAIGKENYAHLGILTSSIVYFIALGLLIFFDLSTIYLLIGCIVLADFSGMLVRLFFARKFKLL